MRYGLRWLTRSRGFAAAAILPLGLGIGANTAAFSRLHAVLLKFLPVARPELLVVMSYVTGHPVGWRRARSIASPGGCSRRCAARAAPSKAPPCPRRSR